MVFASQHKKLQVVLLTRVTSKGTREAVKEFYW